MFKGSFFRSKIDESLTFLIKKYFSSGTLLLMTFYYNYFNIFCISKEMSSMKRM